jgi:chromosome segregation ATPase
MEDKDKIIAELKADIKELGSIIECKNGTIATLAKTRDNLKAENERLKQEKENLIEQLVIYNQFENSYNECRNRYNKYRQTLQEIKTIAEKIMLTELCNSCDGCGLIYGCNDTDCAYYQMEKILQKITKAEEE